MDKKIVAFVFMAVVLINAMTYITALPLSNEDYSSSDIDEAFRMLPEMPMKRGMCRQGFTYQPITRSCRPSLGALRGRGGRRRY